MQSLFVGAAFREMKRQTTLVEDRMDRFSDAGSIPAASTNHEAPYLRDFA